MNATRREFLAGTAAVALAATIGDAFAQADWKPTREVEFVIPFAVGGGADLMARIIQDHHRGKARAGAGGARQPAGRRRRRRHRLCGGEPQGRSAHAHPRQRLDADHAHPQPERPHLERGAANHEHDARRLRVLRERRRALEDGCRFRHGCEIEAPQDLRLCDRRHHRRAPFSRKRLGPSSTRSTSTAAAKRSRRCSAAMCTRSSATLSR